MLLTRVNVNSIYNWIKNSVGTVPVVVFHKTIQEPEKRLVDLKI